MHGEKNTHRVRQRDSLCGWQAHSCTDGRAFTYSLARRTLVWSCCVPARQSCGCSLSFVRSAARDKLELDNNAEFSLYACILVYRFCVDCFCRCSLEYRHVTSDIFGVECRKHVRLNRSVLLLCYVGFNAVLV